MGDKKVINIKDYREKLKKDKEQKLRQQSIDRILKQAEKLNW